YVVKGMDFSFSGIMSAAKDLVDEGVPVDDVSCGLQETIFAMLTEVAERALSLTGRDELVLGGGVGQNARLREMLGEMAEQRGAEFYAPEPELLRDNAGMIAVLGATMAEAGDTIPIEDSRIDSDFRPDQVPVTWRDGDDPEPRGAAAEFAGAEAVVEFEESVVRKIRQPKSYRHPTLDERLRRERTVQEARLTQQARQLGVPTPIIRDIDLLETTMEFERVGERDLRDALTLSRVAEVGEHLATIHGAGFVHGDPTVRNVRVREVESGPETVLIDFGLGYSTEDVEDHAMDLHVFEQSLDGTATNPDELAAAAEEHYAARGETAVIDRLREIEGRGRYQ
ncbi:MAG: KEOPS complex kinase/ATPase Bud32, partial [Halodesulfurarchaeum sp.]